MSRFEQLDPGAFALPAEVAERLTSPALVIDLDRVRRNIECILARTGGHQRWRPHVKTTKTPKIWRELVVRGVRQFKCATAREARALAEMLGASEPQGGDVLLAHPAQGPTLQRLGQLAAEHTETRFSILSEDPEHVAKVPENVGVFVDIDPGYHRTGLGLDRRDGIFAVARAAGKRFRGLHYYEGQLTEADLRLRQERAFAGYDELIALLGALESEGLACEELITSGTPGFQCALAYPAFGDLGATLHRVSPGTVVFHDWRSEEQNPDLELEPAAVVFTRVVSHPAEGRITCDAGSKSIAAEAGHPCAFVIGHPELVGRVPSEEHLPFECVDGTVPVRGTELYLIPRHVCPTVNLAEEALLVQDGAPVEVIPITARAHDTLLRELDGRP